MVKALFAFLLLASTFVYAAHAAPLARRDANSTTLSTVSTVTLTGPIPSGIILPGFNETALLPSSGNATFPDVQCMPFGWHSFGRGRKGFPKDKQSNATQTLDMDAEPTASVVPRSAVTATALPNDPGSRHPVGAGRGRKGFRKEKQSKATPSRTPDSDGQPTAASVLPRSPIIATTFPHLSPASGGVIIPEAGADDPTDTDPISPLPGFGFPWAPIADGGLLPDEPSPITTF